MKKVIIWRDYVYKNHECPRCPTKITKENTDEPADNVLVDKDNNLFCPECGLCVGKIMQVDMTNEELEKKYIENGGKWD